MDSLTQIVLGASVGELAIGKKVGNKAILWGAIAGTIPDLDVLSRSILHPVAAANFHRGPSHSITFDLLFAPLLGYFIYWIYRKKGEATWWDWTRLSFWALFTHPLLDCFTTWGTKLFWPFTDYAVAWQTIFVVDPLYTLPFMFFLIWAMFKHRDSKVRRRLNGIGLIVSSLYLCITVVDKMVVNNVFEETLATADKEVSRFDSRPAPLQNLLWTVNAETDSGYYVGYYSLADKDKLIDYKWFPKHHNLLDAYQQDEHIQTLFQITKGWYTVRQYGDTLVMNDLRFGSSTGWDPSDNWVFSFRIVPGDELDFEQVQARPDNVGELMGQLWDRMWGDKSQPPSAE